MMRSILSTKNIRYFSSKNVIHSLITSEYKEVSIPIPWGHISGKWWGPTDCKPLLCMHGLRDNCGSFDKLIPLLGNDRPISFLAIDLPGHGFSSRHPQGTLYDVLSYLILVQHIYEYFKWEKLSLLGHSLGSILSLISTILYPDKVNFIICIDALGPVRTPISKESVKKSVDNFMRYSRFTEEPPSHSKDELIQIMKSAHKNSLSTESILCLLERCIAPSKKYPGKYYFTDDSILKVRTMFNWEQEQLLQDVATVNNPIFVCEAVKDNRLAKNYRKRFHDLLDVLRKNSNDCEFHAIEGTHHLHLDEADKLSDLINKFLDKHYIEESSNLSDMSIFSEPVPSYLTVQKGALKHVINE